MAYGKEYKVEFSQQYTEGLFKEEFYIRGRVYADIKCITKIMITNLDISVPFIMVYVGEVSCHFGEDSTDVAYLQEFEWNKTATI